ncbi:MAG TPA: hypothetical protein VGN72_06180 [Tepidisphaeraceae bacterium]|jgi:hypothetical protein|nr:hypothetical protein [Tepidisphaeraceae bacterium]
MTKSIKQPVTYASVPAIAARRPVPRWVMIAVSALGGTCLVLLLVAAATDPEPARAARSLAREHGYAALLAGAAIAAHSALRLRNRSQARPTSVLAVLSVLLAILNPVAVDLLCGLIGIARLNAGGGSSEMYSFAAGLAALAVGIVAAARVHYSRGRISGMRWAIVGIMLGLLWVVGWILLALMFAMAMGNGRW